MKYDKWIIPVSIALMLLVGIILYPGLPEQLPRQWGFDGQVTSTWPKLQAILFPPFLALAIWGMFYILPKVDPRREQYAKFEPTYWRLQQAIVVFLFGMQVITLTQYDNAQLVNKFILFAVALLMAFLGNEMGRIRQTWFVGIRTPWTLADERVWKITHRAGARFYVAAGILNMLIVLLLPMPAAGIFLVVTMLAVSFGLIGYSYVVWRQLYS
jgi:uncharacterized membrane protein